MSQRGDGAPRITTIMPKEEVGSEAAKQLSTACARDREPIPKEAITAEEEVRRAFEGKVKSFSLTRNYGFIECNETFEKYGRDVFLTMREAHAAGKLTVGTRCQFRVAKSGPNGEPHAVCILALHPKDSPDQEGVLEWRFYHDPRESLFVPSSLLQTLTKREAATLITHAGYEATPWIPVSPGVKPAIGERRYLVELWDAVNNHAGISGQESSRWRQTVNDWPRPALGSGAKGNEMEHPMTNQSAVAGALQYPYTVHSQLPRWRVAAGEVTQLAADTVSGKWLTFCREKQP
ncbi:hypothetical protein CYMTET_37499 [Cymbomonas tetramitiformis]|uniref:CSD domain-containing protein n=1 Tax=Cymbomonas tetramitiformis TaxID=36881 RepID=A0AAE0CG02_9CHLO|nr:hypothetical protein CYMTET_37499 [Cymbomonas tetramitiformis]